MAIDFTLTPQQRELQLASRKFAKDVLSSAKPVYEKLPTPEERFLATKPAYEAMVAAGFLRKCIPAPAGGENAGLIDMAIMAEELYSVNASITLTMLGTVLGLLPILIGGTPEQCGRRRRHRAKVCGPLQNSATITGSSMAGRNGFPRRRVGTAGAPMSCAWYVEQASIPSLRRQYPS